MDNQCILFVDDEKEICEKFAISFELENFKVLTAYSGWEAVEVLEQNPDIAFVISDVKMPNGDGTFLLNYINEHIHHKLNIVMLSGHSSVKEDEFVKMGAIGLMAKPTNIDDLIEFVKSRV